MSRIACLHPRALLAATALASVTVVGLPLAQGTALAASSTSISLHATSSITYGSATSLTGRLLGSGAGRAGQLVVVQGRPQGSTRWQPVATVRTAAHGAFHTVAHPTRGMQYRAISPAASHHGRAVSAARTVGVRPLVTSSLDTTSVTQGIAFHLHIVVAPAQPGATVTWQQGDGTAWTDGGSAVLNGSGEADISLSSANPGTFQLRATTTRTTRLLAGASTPVGVTVSQAPPKATPPAAPVFTPPAPPSLPGGGPPGIPGAAAE